MKNSFSNWTGKTQSVSFCSVASEVQCIEIAGQKLVPNDDVAYVEFFMSHAFGVKTKYRTAIMPQVVMNSYLTLLHKMLNLAHMMRSYDPVNITRDRMLGQVVAVEFPPMPEGGWDYNNPPGIRAVATMQRAAESVDDILMSWFTGKNPVGGEWTVSMENSFVDDEGGFLVYGTNGVEAWVAKTPEDLKALGCTYVPWGDAPAKLLACMNTAADDKRESMVSRRICRDFLGQEVCYLLGGLDGSIRYRGVGLTPSQGAREAEAKVSTMLASAPMVDPADALAPLFSLGNSLFGK